MRITSHLNPKIKNLIRLGKGRGKDRKELFVFEGIKEIELALEAGVEIHSFYYCEDIAEANLLEKFLSRIDPAVVYEITPAIFSRLAYRESSGGMLVVGKSAYLKLSDIRLTGHPMILVLESVEKPGNLGGILRTADAAGVDAVLICDPLTDLYNPNIIRSSLGTIFTKQVVVCTTSDALSWLRAHHISIFATDLFTDAYYQDVDFTSPCAIVMGTEHNGLSRFWLEAADRRIKIPMHGSIDSLNVSTAAAILVFEAVRQRNISSR
ncbi:MAG TPA: RNA methyltransferase [Bacteroidales bacterium]|nr:RNA methyltransferase [Bacteroidales bacterium]HSA43198.1 RNA methyltransferase [Bacteroidales bacterium]